MNTLKIFTTYLCNMDCKFCISHIQRDRESSVSLELLDQALDQAGPLGFKSICLSGGELCVHPEYEQLIDLVVRKGFSFHILSNGYEYTKYAAILKEHKNKLENITFSLDSHKKELHDKIRREGSYLRVLEAIKVFRDQGINVSVSMCLNTFNYKDLEDYVYFTDKLNLKYVLISNTLPTPTNDKFVLTDEQRKECLEVFNSLKKRIKTPLLRTTALRLDKGLNYCKGVQLDALTINPKGELVFCCDYDEKRGILGSLKEENLSRLIEKADGFANFLKTVRQRSLEQNVSFEGFDTCFFCHESLKRD